MIFLCTKTSSSSFYFVYNNKQFTLYLKNILETLVIVITNKCAYEIVMVDRTLSV